MEVVRRKSDRPPVLLVLLILVCIAAAAVGISAYENSPKVKLSRAITRAEKACADKDYETAVDAANEALSLDGDNADAYSILIDSYAGEENYTAMCAAFDDAQEKLQETDADRLRNKVLTVLNNAAQAAETKSDPDTAISLYQSVISYAASGSQLATQAQEKIDALTANTEETADPKAQYEEILKNDPDNTDALRGLADACEDAGDQEGAKKALKKLIGLDDAADESLILEYVSLCMDNADYGAALDVLNEAYAKTKSQTLYGKILSVMAAQAKSATGTEAVDLWQALLLKSPKYVDAYSSLSDLYYDLGEYDKAVHILETGYELTEDSLLSRQLSSLNKKLAAAGITVDDTDTKNPVEELAQYAAENNYADALKVMAKKEFPKYANCISMALTPMTLTARMIRTQHPNAKIVFVGPCAAKKLEAMRKSIRSEVDFVLTFEEMAGMMEAKQIDYLSLADDNKSDFDVASADGRGFAVAGGVATAVVNAIHRRYPDREVNVANASLCRPERQSSASFSTK